MNNRESISIRMLIFMRYVAMISNKRNFLFGIFIEKRAENTMSGGCIGENKPVVFGTLRRAMYYV